jgi:putative inorganic carbon (HCO3(-)) transporter
MDTTSTHKLNSLFNLVVVAMLAGIILALNIGFDSSFTLPKMIALRVAVLFLSMLCLKAFIDGTARKPDKIVLISTSVLLTSFIVSTITSIDISTALNGVHDRNNGLWTHLGFIALFLSPLILPLDKADIAEIPFALAVILVPPSLMEITQRLDITRFWFGDVSSIGNRVAMGAVISFAIPFALLKTVRSEALWQRIAWGAILLLLMAAELCTLARGPWLGLIIGMSTMLILLAWRERTWRRVLAAILIGSTILSISLIAFSPDIRNRIASLEKPLSDVTVNTRVIYFVAAWRVIKDHPFLGIGLENFRNVYPDYRDIRDRGYFENTVPTMVHNGYLQLAATAGLPSLLAYLLIVTWLIRTILLTSQSSVTLQEREILLAFLAGMIAYLVQDMSGWQHMALTPVFWLLAGCALAYARSSFDVVPASRIWKSAGITLSLSCMLMNLYLLNDIYAMINNDRAVHQAKAAFEKNQWPFAVSELKKALSALPDNAYSEEVAAMLWYERYLATDDPDAYLESSRLFEASHRHNPFNIPTLYSAMRLESAALQSGISTKRSDFMERSISQLARTHSDDPRFHFHKALVLMSSGKFQAAAESVKQARGLDPENSSYAQMEADLQKILEQAKKTDRNGKSI